MILRNSHPSNIWDPLFRMCRCSHPASLRTHFYCEGLICSLRVTHRYTSIFIPHQQKILGEVRTSKGAHRPWFCFSLTVCSVWISASQFTSQGLCDDSKSLMLIWDTYSIIHYITIIPQGIGPVIFQNICDIIGYFCPSVSTLTSH